MVFYRKCHCTAPTHYCILLYSRIMKEKNKASAIHSLWLIDSLQNIEFHIHIIPCKHTGYLWQFRTFTGSYQSSLLSQDQTITYFSAETNRESFAWMKQHPLSNVSHHGWLSPWQLWPSYTVFFLPCCLRQNKVLPNQLFSFSATSCHLEFCQKGQHLNTTCFPQNVYHHLYRIALVSVVLWLLIYFDLLYYLF